MDTHEHHDHGPLGPNEWRLEDQRLLTGGGRYSDDFALEGQAYAVFLRSPFAHGEITTLDVAPALEMPGVLGVYTGADLEKAGLGGMPAIFKPEGVDGKPPGDTYRPALAVKRVRYVGEPIAVVVAETRAQAEDAVEAIGIEIEPLPVVAELAKARDADAPQIWDHAPGNLALHWRFGDPAKVDAALAASAHVTRLKLVIPRIIGVALEPRSALADYDPATEKFLLHSGSQGVNMQKLGLARAIFRVDPSKIRVVSRDVGGGFGIKTEAYPEYVAIMFAARALERPVKWTGTRSEMMLADNQARDSIHEAALGLDKDGKFTAIKVDSLFNMGAYISSHGFVVPRNIPACSPSLYATPLISTDLYCCFSNTTPTGPYRGAGRPEANYIVESLIEKAARETGRDRVELRRINLIPAEAMPYDTPTGFTYDSGNFPGVFEKAVAMADIPGFAARRAESEARGKLRGLGIGCFIEPAGGPSEEEIRLAVDDEGTITLATALQTNGQGHETTYAEIIGGRLGVSREKVKLQAGDSDLTPVGFGSFGSRSTYIGGSAMILAAKELIDTGRRAFAHRHGLDLEEVTYDAGRFAGGGKAMTLGELSGWMKVANDLPDDLRTGGLMASAKWVCTKNTFPNGCHICEVEIDRETGVVQVLSYVGIDDCGTVISPALVHGQVMGGVAQGLGQALSEVCVRDEGGQLLTGTFMDYAMPRFDSMPEMTVDSFPVPSTTNPIGAKGAGEAGTTGSLPAIMTAINDALASAGVERIDPPATPSRIWARLRGM